MTGSYTAAQRRELARALEDDAPLTCPVCGATLARREVSPSPALAYVRRRVLLICPSCKRSAAIDLPRREFG